MDIYYSESKTWEAIDHDQLCYSTIQNTPASTTSTTCEIYASAVIPAQEFAYLRVEKVYADSPQTIENMTQPDSHVISNEFVELGYDSTDDDGVSFFNYKS